LIQTTTLLDSALKTVQLLPLRDKSKSLRVVTGLYTTEYPLMFEFDATLS
jgi:hypothetical protein